MRRPPVPAGRIHHPKASFAGLFFVTFCGLIAVGPVLPVLPRYIHGPLGRGDLAVGFVIGIYAATGLLLGSRNTLYGLRLAPLLDFRGWRRVGAAHLLIDESTAMSVNRESTPAARGGFLSTGLAVFLLWNLATFGGALAGTALGDPRTYGLDAAVGAAFLALLWPRLRKGFPEAATQRRVAVGGAVVALALTPFVPAGVQVVAAVVAVALAGRPRAGERPTASEEMA